MADFIKSLVEWAGAEPLPYLVDGPESLIVNTTAKGDTRVLHLINWTGDKSEQHGLSEYHIAPVRDVHIQMRKPAGREIGGLHLLLEADL